MSSPDKDGKVTMDLKCHEKVKNVALTWASLLVIKETVDGLGARPRQPRGPRLEGMFPSDVVIVPLEEDMM